MGKVKTTFTKEDVAAFIENAGTEKKRNDSLVLLQLMEAATGEKAEMFGPTIVGFGKYHYKYPTGHEGVAPLVGFSPRKAAFSLYVFTGADEHRHLLEGLGKYKMGKACIYVNKLSDINLDVLQNIMKESIAFISEKYIRL